MVLRFFYSGFATPLDSQKPKAAESTRRIPIGTATRVFDENSGGTVPARSGPKGLKDRKTERPKEAKLAMLSKMCENLPGAEYWFYAEADEQE